MLYVVVISGSMYNLLTGGFIKRTKNSQNRLSLVAPKQQHLYWHQIIPGTNYQRQCADSYICIPGRFGMQAITREHDVSQGREYEKKKRPKQQKRGTITGGHSK